jgi:hypothetical protein
MGAVEAAGFTVIDDFSGTLTSTDNEGGDVYASHMIIARKEQLSRKKQELAYELRRRVQELPSSAMHLTHEQQWSEKQRKKSKEMRRPKRLPHPFLHQQYSFKDFSFSVPYRTAERQKQQKQIEYIRHVVALLRDLKTQGKDLLAFSPDDFTELRDLGVNHMPTSKPHDPTFYIVNDEMDIHQIIHPLDPVWD